MALIAAVPLELPVDGRQSETALAVARGTARLLHAYGRCVVSELPLPSGRRADLAALDPSGEIWIVEIKSSIADFRTDQKWQDYRAHCDRLFFATTVEVPCGIQMRGARPQACGCDTQIDDVAVCARRGTAAAIPGGPDRALWGRGLRINAARAWPEYAARYAGAC